MLLCFSTDTNWTNKTPSVEPTLVVTAVGRERHVSNGIAFEQTHVIQSRMYTNRNYCLVN